MPKNSKNNRFPFSIALFSCFLPFFTWPFFQPVPFLPLCSAQQSNHLARWTKWHKNGHFDTSEDLFGTGNGLFGRVRTCGTDIALFSAKTLKYVRLQKQASLLQSSMQNNYSYSSCKQRKLFNLN